jgi:hypothetical protein
MPQQMTQELVDEVADLVMDCLQSKSKNPKAKNPHHMHLRCSIHTSPDNIEYGGIVISPSSEKRFAVDVNQLSGIFQKQETVEVFNQLKGDRRPCIRVHGWYGGFFFMIDIFLEKDKKGKRPAV